APRIVDAHADLQAARLHHLAAQPFASADADLELAAHLLPDLLHRRSRLALELPARSHHPGRRAGERVVLPRAAVHVAARPAIRAEALALVGDVRALVALALPRPASPRVHALALLAVLDE